MLNEIIKIVNEITGFSFEKPVRVLDIKNVYVKDAENEILIGGLEKADYARALTLYAREYKKGNKCFEITEKRHFKKLGAYFDVSRGGVLKVSTIKKYAKEMLCMGFNRLYLYMEDVFELDGYPHFGYLRGRYSKQELKEISAFGDKIGVEMIPCVQTLGHMGQYLQWNESAPVKDTSQVLLCGSEDTYKFIEAIISTMRECFPTSNIQIGCDEAFGLGTGKFLSENGYKKPIDILIPHIHKVYDICKKYNFTPSMFVDTFIRNLNDEKRYYIHNLEIPEGLGDNLPDIKTVYWDYYHFKEEDYDMMIDYHKKFKEIPEFAGGIWTWAGNILNVKHTFDTMIPAMKSSIKNGISEVYATMYGDDGTECNYGMGMPLLNIFSEYCFKGLDASFDTINDMTKFLYDVDCSDYINVSGFYYPFVNNLLFRQLSKPNCFGQKIFSTDIFYNLTGTTDFSEFLPYHIEAYNAVCGLGKGTKWEEYYKYMEVILDITIHKMDILSKLSAAYKNNDKEYLKKAAEEYIPYIIKKYKELYSIHEKQWLKTYKPFGWEEHTSRYAHWIFRLEYAIKVITGYLKGEIEKIEELEFELIEDTYGGLSFSGFNRFKVNRTIKI